MSPEKVDDALTLWSKRLGLVLLGWFASAAYHQTAYSDRALQVLPTVQKLDACEHARADKASKLALSNNIVTPEQLPKDCAHPPIPPAPTK